MTEYEIMRRLISTVLAIVFCSNVFALMPCEVLVVVNADEPKSISIGSYYIRSRNLPQSNLAPLRLGADNNTTISQNDYEQMIAAPLRQLLQQAEYRHIRCLLTTYKMPYKITPSPMSEEQAAVKSQLEIILANHSEILAGEVADLLDESAAAISYKDTTELIAKAKQKIAATIERIKSIDDEGEKTAEIERFFVKTHNIYSVFILTQLADIEFNHPYRPAAGELEQAVNSRIFTNKAVRESWKYEKQLKEGYYEHFLNVYGRLELVELLDNAIKSIGGIGVSSATDSELAFVRFGDYEKYLWHDNPLRQNIYDNSTLMVSRIDAPSEAFCRRLIDDSIYAEQNGLRGNACIDARFEPNKAPEKYASYDNSLYITAEMFNNCGLEVVLEDTQAIFTSKPPLQTAIYCGWYSLGKYIDSFKFSRGAVGYHISSLDAVDIRDSSNNQWVSSMLERGIAATIGAVDEPYLTAFPLPQLFFSRLIAGDCIAEAFAKTNPYLSWQVMLIGDPLYTPFR